MHVDYWVLQEKVGILEPDFSEAAACPMLWSWIYEMLEAAAAFWTLKQ